MSKRKPSSLEARWLHVWSLFGEKRLLEAEVRFHPTRRWRFDFGDRKTRVAVELEGGTWIGGRHTTGAGFEGDAIKYNAATTLGWRVFRFTTSMLRADPKGCVELVLAAILGARTIVGTDENGVRVAVSGFLVDSTVVDRDLFGSESHP